MVWGLGSKRGETVGETRSVRQDRYDTIGIGKTRATGQPSARRHHRERVTRGPSEGLGHELDAHATRRPYKIGEEDPHILLEQPLHDEGKDSHALELHEDDLNEGDEFEEGGHGEERPAQLIPAARLVGILLGSSDDGSTREDGEGVLKEFGDVVGGEHSR